MLIRDANHENHASGTVEIAGKTVHRLGFGAMRLAGYGIWGEAADRDECIRIVRRLIDLGVDFIDTAAAYGPHVSEEVIRDAIHPYPEHILITTKAGQIHPAPMVFSTFCRPDFLRQECELSLRRLGLDQIELFQLHQVDPQVPFEDQVGEMQKLKDEGKIVAIGLNEVTVEQIISAREIADIATVQNQYSLTHRKHDDVLEYCTRENLPFISWFPLDRGALTKHGGPLDAITEAAGATQAQVALAWLLARAPNMVTIPGTSSMAHLEENVGAAQLGLTADQIAELTALAA